MIGQHTSDQGSNFEFRETRLSCKDLLGSSFIYLNITAKVKGMTQDFHS